MEKFSLAKFLGITEEELLITSARNTKRNNEEEAKRKVDIARLKDLSPKELRLIDESLAAELLEPPTMPTHGINY